MDWLAAALLAAATLAALALLWLLKRLTPDPPKVDPVPHQRHGTIVMVRCYDCGELVERHNAVLSGASWFCRDPERCPPEQS